MYPVQHREIARRLRNEGYSYKEIATSLNVAKNTAFEWTRDIILSPSAEHRLSERINNARERSGFTQYLSKQKRIDIIRLGEQEYLKNNLTNIPAKLLCSLIYWCEGAKNDTNLCFTNSDPNLVRTFLQLLRNSYELDEKKFRLVMHLHDYHQEWEQKEFWSKVTRISPSLFSKSYLKPHTGKRKRTGYQGCVSIRYHDSVIARSLLTLAQEFMHI